MSHYLNFETFIFHANHQFLFSRNFFNCYHFRKNQQTYIRFRFYPHIPRDAALEFPKTHTKRPGLTACPASWAMGIKEIVYGEEKSFYTGPTRAANAGQKSLVPARWAKIIEQGRIPLICTPWVPIHLSFNSQQGPPLCSIFIRSLPDN
jgi:hypothetical protein